MNHQSFQITDAEWEVMQAVWQAENQAAGEIIARVQESRAWNHRTIRTLLTRLVQKEAIEVWTERSKHFYRAAVSREECVRSAAKSFRERFFGGDVKSLLMHFVENEGISNDELEDIRRALLSQEPTQRGRRRKGS